MPIRGATRIAVSFVFVAILVAALAVGSFLVYRNTSSNQMITETSAPVVTLEDIIAGKFSSAIDKQGSGGVLVTVQHLKVIYVENETDGDWHVAVTDGRVPVFITEITPAYQIREGRPHAGAIIDETGIAFCDTIHQNQAWHGNTCWEIHPVTSWQLSQNI